MRALLIGGFALFASCAKAPDPAPAIQPVFGQRAEPTVVSRTSLGVPTSGVTVDPLGHRFVWVRGVGLHQLTETGLTLTLAVGRLNIAPSPEIEDLAIIDDNRLAVIAKNEGFVVGLTTGQRYNRFCYLPEDVQLQDPSAWQLSRALAYDAKEDRLYVQPQTFTGAGRLTGSQLGLFDPSLPTPREWQGLTDPTFAAGGLAVDSRERVYLGMGTRLYQYDATARRFDTWWELEGVVGSIEGLAVDRVKGTLLVVDGQDLVELRLDH